MFFSANISNSVQLSRKFVEPFTELVPPCIASFRRCHACHKRSRIRASAALSTELRSNRSQSGLEC
jgi:hypothetical protein